MQIPGNSQWYCNKGRSANGYHQEAILACAVKIVEHDALVQLLTCIRHAQDTRPGVLDCRANT